MIIIGFPGINENLLLEKEKFIALDYHMFWNYSSLHEEFYSKIAIDLSKQGFDVFISYNEGTVKYLVEHAQEALNPQDMLIIYPSKNIEYEWIEIMKNRSKSTHLRKHCNEYLHIQNNYAEILRKINLELFYMNPGTIIRYEIGNINYDLIDIIHKVKESIEYRKRDKKYDINK